MKRTTYLKGTQWIQHFSTLKVTTFIKNSNNAVEFWWKRFNRDVRNFHGK
jgi:hypothetical protein